MRIIIAGGRDFNDKKLLISKTISIIRGLKNEGFNTSKECVEIISGTANGADKIGELFASKYNLKTVRFPANWDKYGKSAGYRRNAEMAKYASEDDDLGILVAFWDGKSRGTKHMIDLANKSNLKVYIVNY